MRQLWDDLKLGARTLARSPGFTAVAVLTLALGIGATTVMFSVGDALFLRALPYPNAERLVALRSTHRAPAGSGVPDGERTAAANLADWRAQATSFESMAGYYWRTVDLMGGARGERLRGLVVTPEFFDVFGVRQMEGRRFNAEDRGTATIILGRDVWRRRFAADTRVIGQPLDLNVIDLSRLGPTPFVVLGAVTTDVHFPPLTADYQLGVSNLTESVDFWLPAFISSSDNRDDRQFDVVAKLRPGVTVAQAQVEMDGIASRLAAVYPASNRGWGVRVVPLRNQIVGSARRALLWLSLCTGMVLLISCGNVASLLLARGLAHQRDVAIRSALGAGRMRIIRQLLAEPAVIALMACACGVLLTWWCIAWLRPLLPSGMPLLQAIALDGKALGATLLCAVWTVGFTGMAPALRISRVGSVDLAGLAGRGLSPDRGRHRTLQMLVAFEVALTLILLIATGLMLTSAAHLWQVDPGFNAKHLLTMTISLPNNKFDWKHNVAFSSQVVESVTSLAPVRGAAVIQGLPMRPGGFWNVFEVEGQPQESGDLPVARLRVVSPGYFDVMQIPIRSGRDFDARDEVGEIGHLPEVIVSQALASHYWPGENAVGKRIRTGGAKSDAWTTVIGVVGDVRYASMDAAPAYDLYLPEALFPQAAITLVVRTRDDPSGPVLDIRSRIEQIDPDAFVTDIRPMEDVISDSLAPRRSSTILLGAFAGLALLLAATGIYGVIAYTVTQRRLEIGIRMALGAQKSDVLKTVIGDGIKPALIGISIGVVCALAVTRFLSSLLYGVAPTDPITFAGMIVLLLGVAFLACYIPARRTTKDDPMVALRHE